MQESSINIVPTPTPLVRLGVVPLAPTKMHYHTAKVITGGLSQTAKMPCKSYSIPATACHVGSQLRNVADSVCSGCYAMKGNYARFKSVAAHQAARLAAITHPDWVEAMCLLIKRDNAAYFRWHDAGDLQSYDHMTRIADIATRLPETKFWLPTLEHRLVLVWLRHNVLPANLTVRLSTAMVDSMPSRRNLPTSSVTTDALMATCSATRNHTACGACRACWDKSVPHITYLKH